jgi:hypothetical protein
VALTCILAPSEGDKSGSDSSIDNRAGTGACASEMICPGEELVYEVSWMSVRLGQIRLRAHAPSIDNGQVEHHVAGYIDSYDGLPMIDLHVINHSWLSKDFYSLTTTSKELKKGKWSFERYRLNQPNKTLIIERTVLTEKNGRPETDPTFDTLQLNTPDIQDGLSILYFARANIRSGRVMTVPTVVYGKEGSTVFQFSNQIETIEFQDQNVRVLPLVGRADFEGIFGFTGDFKGWFSDDVAAVPIKGELKVLIGSVKLELVQWKRDGWNPPASTTSSANR